MNHAITFGDLISVGGVLIGLVLTAIGALAYVAGAMSDAPSEGDNYGRFGCSLFVTGALILGFCVWGMVS